MAEEEIIQNTNVAKDQSHVHVQVGLVKGNITFDNTSQVDLQHQLAELHRDLLAAWECNELDEETFAAASDELSKAAEYSVDSKAGQGKLIVCLKRLKGLVDGIADLGSKVATIIAAIHNVR
jgi:hypothetical protein